MEKNGAVFMVEANVVEYVEDVVVVSDGSIKISIKFNNERVNVKKVYVSCVVCSEKEKGDFERVLGCMCDFNDQFGRECKQIFRLLWLWKNK